MRQPGGGVCRLHTPIVRCAFPEEGSVDKSLSYQARRELLQQAVPQYREASPSQKRTLLDAFVAATGYHRTYARWLLNHAEEVQQILHRPRPSGSLAMCDGIGDPFVIAYGTNASRQHILGS